jgi:hypothetical protein
MHLSTKMDSNLSLPILLIHDDTMDLGRSLPPMYRHALRPAPLSGHLFDGSAGCEELAEVDKVPSIKYHSYRLRVRQPAEGQADLQGRC